jgi:mono/diheme cytochrome c family protein
MHQRFRIRFLKSTHAPSALAALLAALVPAARGADLYANEVLKDGPVGYYRFEDGEANSGTARNASTAGIRGPDGVMAPGGKSVPGGVVGEAAWFDGQGVLEIPSHPAFDSENLSVELWFRSRQSFDRSYWPGSASLVSKVTGGSGSGDWCLLGGSKSGGRNDGQILVGSGPDCGDDHVLASPAGLNDGQFHHVVWTRSADGQNRLYVDGMLKGSGRDGGGKISNARPIQIGGEKQEAGGSFFTGEIDELAIYAGVLSEERVNVHFAIGKADPRLPEPAAAAVDFVRDIKPLFQDACFKCHGQEKDKGGLSLATKARAMEGGDECTGIIPGNSAASPLVQRIAALDEDTAMPPDDGRLSAAQVGLIRAWIDQGAVWPEGADGTDPRMAKAASHWSFKALKRPPVPDRTDAWITSPIDAFILTKLDEAKLSPAPPAGKEALLRRVSFDLTGLPPAPEDIAAFASDTGTDAFAKVVDRLLASPTYGERWARHWLDVVRYADSGGYETDIFYEQAWRYRDYVIRSFDQDKPYDRFLMEQVAGDELWPGQADMQDAVAVWTLGEWQNALDAYPDMLEYARRTDQVSTLSEAALGLTVGCANCHNHKFDPITQRDYFGLEAIFAASETWNRNTGAKAWGKGERTAYRAVRHAEKPLPIHLLTRGELTKPTKLIAPALPAFLPGGGALPGGPDEAKQRRAQLARWIVSPQNPLTARVIANRIWQWHFGQALASTPNDLGTQGTPPSHPELLDWLASELRENGWSMKSLHRRILLSSAYQQSAIRDPKAIAADPHNQLLAGFPRRRLEAEEVWDHLQAAAGTLDTKSFGPPFVPKLSPEELQGMYDLENKPELKWPVTPEQNRRAIYILNRRSFRFPFFEAFDPPNTATSCPLRQTTTVPAQALTLLNNHIVGGQARAMAGRLTHEAGSNLESLVKRAWLLAYSRDAEEGELKLALQFIAGAEASHIKTGAADPHTAALVEFCISVMNTTEFIYTN